MLEEESFMGQWHPLISLWTKRNILINNKTRGITATWHLNINSMHVKYFHITILNTLNKCQGLKNYHFGSLLASKFYCLAIKAVIKRKNPLSWDFLSKKYSIFLDNKEGNFRSKTLLLLMEFGHNDYEQFLFMSHQLKAYNFPSSWVTQSGILFTTQSRIRGPHLKWNRFFHQWFKYSFFWLLLGKLNSPDGLPLLR